MTKENQIKTSPSLTKKKDEVLLMNIGGRTATKIQQCIKAIAEEVVNSGVVHFKNICGGGQGNHPEIRYCSYTWPLCNMQKKPTRK